MIEGSRRRIERLLEDDVLSRWIAAYPLTPIGELAVAAAASALGLSLAWALQPWLGAHGPWLTLFPSLLLAGLLGGTLAATTTLVVCATMGQLLLFGPRGPAFGGGPEQLFSLIAFFVAGGVVAQAGALARSMVRRLARGAVERAEGEERMRIAADSASLGMWFWDMREGRVRWTARTVDLMGLRPDAYETYDGFLSGVYPQDRARVDAAIQGALASRSDFRCELRTVDRDGRPRWVLAVGRAQYDGEERPAGMMGIVLDVSAMRDARRALEESERRLRLHAENSPLAIVERDLEGRVIRWSAEAERVFGWSAAEALGRRIEDIGIRDEDEGTRGEGAFSGARRDKAALRSVTLGRNRRKDGQVIYCAWYSSALLDGAGDVLSVYSQISDRTSEVQAIEAARRVEQELREADQRKDEFLAMLAHELRNPLAPIRNAVHVMRTLAPALPDLDHAREIIERQVVHMARLVDDLLEVSRITRGDIRVQKAPLDLADVVREAVETASPLIESGEHSLAVNLAPEPILLEADHARLVQVLGNLLTNAAKFTPRGGYISIETERTADGRAVVRVRDTGIGVPAGMRERIFDLFAQEESNLARSHGGLGIGLTLVKRLVELHGGTVELESQGRGRGTTVTVSLPALSGGRAQPVAVQAALPAERRHGRRIRVLIVEDNVDTAESFQMVLELAGHEVRAAHDGRDALRLLDEFVPEVAFLDLGLPGLSGFDVAAHMRADARTKDIVLVAVSGYGQPEDKDRARAAGFDHHFIKPVDLAAVSGVLAAMGASTMDSGSSSRLVH